MNGSSGNGYLNGSAAGVSAPTAVPTVITQPAGDGNTLAHINRAGSAEISRFMPVMDIEQALQRRQVIVDAASRLMKAGVDFGKIPGTERETLLQPGADKLCNLFGLVIEYEIVQRVEDWTGECHGGESFFFYEVKAKAYRGEFVMGEGTGSCNSWEKKYRWRQTDRTCPQCGKATIRKSRQDEGWYCWRRIDGCGAQFPLGDRSIEGQEVGRKPNPDVAEVVNTILKMAHKRAKIAATINATSASEFFTQDVEDFTPAEEAPIDTGGAPPNSPAAAAYVAAQKIAASSAGSARPWKNMGEMAEWFKQLREQLGETIYLAELKRYGWSRFQDIKNSIDNKSPLAEQKAIECFTHLMAQRKGAA